MTTISLLIHRLVAYAARTGLIEECDRAYSLNRLIELLMLDGIEECAVPTSSLADDDELEEILGGICDYAAEHGIIESNTVVYRDLFDTKLMGALTPRPSEVQRRFAELYKESPRRATDYFYGISRASDYIRAYRVKRDLKWSVPSEYGDIDISINLSKPEKDPKAIAAAKLLPQAGYPKCLLCRENEGYAGRVNHPARQNHRLIPLAIDGCSWFMQYSPYVYYNEHCIVLNSEHTPMAINRSTFGKLLDFIEYLPHYFIGSNADLPIVGGSILSHDHMQGGCYTFPMEKAMIDERITFKGFEDVEAGIVKWPMSVIRIASADKARLVDLSDRILGAWRGYTDEDAFILAETDGEPHNTITPIARTRNGKFELDLVLRNNITTNEHPLGVYHPHAQYHNIKKENIGLIEVMGLAILPARLKSEIAEMKRLILSGGDLRSCEATAKHADWFDCFKDKYSFTEENTEDILRAEIGVTFTHVLEDAGVYKNTAEGRCAFRRFIEYLNR